MRNRSMEGLRGLAAMMVLFSHIGVMFYPAFYWNVERSHFSNNMDFLFGQSPFSFLLNGNSGVIIFLIITGFGAYAVCKKGIAAIRKFIALRYFKLLVLCIISVFLIWICVQLDVIYYDEILAQLNTPWFDGYNPYQNPAILVLEKPLEMLQLYNNTLWTMKYFFVGAIIATLFSLIVLDSGRLKGLLYFLAIVILVNMNEVYYIPCILGVAIADVYDQSFIKANNVKGMLLILVGAYLCAYPSGGQAQLFWYSFLPYDYMLYYHIIGAALICYAVLFTKSLTKLFETPVFQFLGKYSFSIYIVQYAVLLSFSAFIFKYLSSYLTYNQSAFIAMGGTVVVVLLLSVVVEKVVMGVNRGLNKLYEKVENNGVH